MVITHLIQLTLTYAFRQHIYIEEENSLKNELLYQMSLALCRGVIGPTEIIYIGWFSII